MAAVWIPPWNHRGWPHLLREPGDQFGCGSPPKGTHGRKPFPSSMEMFPWSHELSSCHTDKNRWTWLAAGWIHTCISSHSVSHCWPIPPRIPCSQLAQLQHPRCSWVGHRGLSLSTPWASMARLPAVAWHTLWHWLENVGFHTPGISLLFFFGFPKFLLDSQVKQSLESWWIMCICYRLSLFYSILFYIWWFGDFPRRPRLNHGDCGFNIVWISQGSVHQGTISTAIFLAFIDLTPDIFRLRMGASNLDTEKVINNIQSLLTPSMRIMKWSSLLITS